MRSSGNYLHMSGSMPQRDADRQETDQYEMTTEFDEDPDAPRQEVSEESISDRSTVPPDAAKIKMKKLA